MNLDWDKYLNNKERRMIFGNEGEDPLTSGYERNVAPPVGLTVYPVDTKENMHMLMNEASDQSSGKKIAYISIPFCQTRCDHCSNFNNYADDDLMEAYCDALIKEIKGSMSMPLILNGDVNAVYIGGGTPAALSKRQIDRLLETVNAYIPMTNDCEFTLEARTFEFSSEKIDICLENGINRFSLEVQSFDTRVRHAVGRIDDGDIVAGKIEELKKHNSTAVSIDLMYGLPYQSEADFISDILQADRLGVDGVSFYNLKCVDEYFDRIKTEKPASVSDQSIYHIKGYRIMNNLGYHQPIVGHWSKGTRDRNLYKMLSKEGCVVHAFGAGAYGKTKGYHYRNHTDLDSYIKAADAGVKPIDTMYQTVRNTELLNAVISHMSSGYLRFDQINKLAETDLMSLFEPLVSSWVQRGMAVLDSNVLKITPVGQFWYINMIKGLNKVLNLVENTEYFPEFSDDSAKPDTMNLL